MLQTQLSPSEYSDEDQVLQNRKKVLLNREKAQLNTIMGVVNCYLREYAIPNKQALQFSLSSSNFEKKLQRSPTRGHLPTSPRSTSKKWSDGFTR